MIDDICVADYILKDHIVAAKKKSVNCVVVVVRIFVKAARV